jgi:hypothetical protein
MCPGVEGVVFIFGDLAPAASAVEERLSAEEKLLCYEEMVCYEFLASLIQLYSVECFVLSMKLSS